MELRSPSYLDFNFRSEDAIFLREIPSCCLFSVTINSYDDIIMGFWPKSHSFQAKIVC